MNNSLTLKQKILTLADHCVKCGLCSSQCPTYRLKQDENESPRGRIAIAQGLAQGAITANEKASEHLSNCLQCRRCESLCPSDVKYGELIQLSHELLSQKTQQPNRLMLLAITLCSKLTHKMWSTLAHLPVTPFLRLSKLGRRLLPRRIKPTVMRASTTPLKPSIFLFTGCLSHILDKSSLQACINLLQTCGYVVNIPSKQVCCGSMASRQGIRALAQICATKNQHAFADHLNDPILFFTTGCGSQLKNYKSDSNNDIGFADRATSISYFLNHCPAFAQLQFSSLKQRVLIYTPCSEQNALKQAGLTQALLERIPNMELLSLPLNTGCCGASGLHLMTHSAQADRIRNPLLDQIISLSPDIIVSPNYPCNLHIQSGLKEKNLDIPIIHPIELLFNQVKL